MFARKLNPHQQLTVVRFHAENKPIADIVSYIREEWGIDYTAKSVVRLSGRNKFQKDYKKFREDFLRKVKDVPIANKRVRIDDLEKVRLKTMEFIKLNDGSTKEKREEFRYLVRTLNDIIINAREEMEKKPFLIAGILGEYSDKTDEELIAERDEILRQAERLITGPVIEIDNTSDGVTGEGEGEPS
jgi:anaerobic glycerol-3-phosphate dehydrogenase